MCGAAFLTGLRRSIPTVLTSLLNDEIDGDIILGADIVATVLF
jgi:hypothetical protein